MTNTEEIREKMSGLSTEELVEIVEVKIGDYTKEEIEVVWDLIEKRGASTQVQEPVESAGQTPRVEREKQDRGGMRSVTLKDEKILDSWATVIEDGSGKSNELFKKTQELFGKSHVPGLVWENINVTPSFLKGVFGKKREYILVTNEGLKDYRMYIGARDYGVHLDVQWYLTVEPGFFKKALAEKLGGPGAMFVLDIFDQQDLRAYATTVHRCLLKAVEETLRGLGQDDSKLLRKSKGFLEVW